MHSFWGGTNNIRHETTVHQQVNDEFIKFDISNTSDDFLNDGILLLQVNETISKVVYVLSQILMVFTLTGVTF